MYLTIGNLSTDVRNSNDRLGTILLALLLVVKDDDATVRSEIFHHCLRMLFDCAIKATDAEG